MDVVEAIHTRRSVRSYLPRPVGRGVIEQVIWDAAQAPPPFCGQLPWTFNVIQGIDRIVAYGHEAKQYARDNHPNEPGWEWTEKPEFQVFWGAPALIIISGRVEDCCRAGQNLMLSAHARGLGTCWVGSPMLWLKTTAAKAKLNIPAELMPVSALCLGYPAAIPDTPPRKRPTIVWLE
ncbi:MAG TPA: nitroreductase family protein [Acetobacteraceae bacterium]|nr:nitroreductase family protein [Acetobacteraceae bacterium]